LLICRITFAASGLSVSRAFLVFFFFSFSSEEALFERTRPHITKGPPAVYLIGSRVQIRRAPAFAYRAPAYRLCDPKRRSADGHEPNASPAAPDGPVLLLPRSFRIELNLTPHLGAPSLPDAQTCPHVGVGAARSVRRPRDP
jgi:hypothetical protein